MSVLPERFGRKVLALSAALALAAGAACSAMAGKSLSQGPAATVPLSDTARDLTPPSKLSPALQRLEASADAARDLNGSDEPPSSLEVGTPMPGTTDVYEVAIHVSPNVDLKALSAAGAGILTQLGEVVYAGVAIHDLSKVADVDGVVSIEAIPGSLAPTPQTVKAQSIEGARELSSNTTGAENFDHQGMTGKGVIVGVVDTGVDWRHGDFRNADGSSRILFFWDPYDNSYNLSAGKVGLPGPFNDQKSGKPIGTVYNTKMITAAIHGEMDIGRTDGFGHGTACLGTAAGNGLGTGGTLPAGTYKGVAPEADLMVVAANPPDDSETGGIANFPGTFGPVWIAQTAAKLHEPCSISLSWGGHMSAHDGTAEDEMMFDKLTNNGDAPGVSICVSAGNEGQESIHARGRFGPQTDNQYQNGLISPVQLFVTRKTLLLAFFDAKDDWQLNLVGKDNFLVGYDKEPGTLGIVSKAGVLNLACSPNITPIVAPFVANFGKEDSNIQREHLKDGRDALIIANLPPGTYIVEIAGATDKVNHGTFDLYLPLVHTASFGLGGDHNMVVGSPSTADSVISVGSYVARNGWDSLQGRAGYNLELGSISNFSNEGFRSDGVVKPDIASPGQFMISTMATGSVMAREAGDITTAPDNKHIIWDGTSASCPFTAGVVALMLGKNPNLSANQIKQILHATADHDDVTGAVPNNEWGYGRLDPAKAIAAVSTSSTPTTNPTPTPTPTPQIASSFVGTWQGDGMTIVLTANPNGTYGGTITRGTLICPVTAHQIAGQLEGAFTLQGQDYPFTASLNGDQLTFTTGSKTHTLARQPTASRDLDGGERHAVLASNSAHVTASAGSIR